MTSATDAERDKHSMMNFEETELRLGLPGGSSSNDGESSSSALIRTNGGNNNKRGFSETADGVVELKLNLSSSNHDDLGSAAVSASSVALDKAKEKNSSSSSNSITTAATASLPRANDPAKPPPKAQVVGWPPVRSFRKKIVNVQRSNKEEAAAEKATTTTTTTTTTATSSGALNNAAFVKVSVDGAPYLRKVDLKLYKSYKELSDALAKMFSSFTISGSCGSQGIVDKEFMNDSKKLMHLLNGSDYVPTYEDRDGDWMLVGDVPWEMFVDSCKRLRIVKGSEAIGLAPRAVEKCKNGS